MRRKSREQQAEPTPRQLRVRAHAMMRRKGFPRIPPPECDHCERAGLKLERHHPDYRRPWWVEWVCVECHQAADELRKAYERAGVDISLNRSEDRSPIIPLDRLADRKVLKSFHLI